MVLSPGPTFTGHGADAAAPRPHLTSDNEQLQDLVEQERGSKKDKVAKRGGGKAGGEGERARCHTIHPDRVNAVWMTGRARRPHGPGARPRW
eukprot:gene27605-13758_t